MCMKSKESCHSVGRVITPAKHNKSPELHELKTAHILAEHYSCDVEFLIPIADYLRKSADILMQGLEWEIKCPTGDSKSTIRNQFRRASKQSKNIIIDMQRTKLDYITVEKEVLFQMKERPYIKKVILIDKSKKSLSFNHKYVILRS